MRVVYGITWFATWDGFQADLGVMGTADLTEG